MRKILLQLFTAVLTLSVGLGTWTVPAQAAFNPEVRESVVVVATALVTSDGYEELSGWGTGFFVGNPKENAEYLITNHHVVDTFLEYGKGEYIDVPVDGGTITAKVKVRVYFSAKEYDEAYVVDYDETKDIALLKLASPTDKRKAIPILSPTDDMIGSTVYCVGYPGLSENAIIDTKSSWGKTDVSVTTGTVSRFVRTSGTGVQRIQTDAVIQQGNSGGPMVNDSGSVIGINSLYVFSDTEMNYYAISIDEAIPMLNTNGVKYVTKGKKGGLGNIPMDKLLPVIIATAAVLLIAIVAVVVSRVRKGKAQPAAAFPADNGGAAQPVFQQQPVVQPKTAVVRSLSAQHNGMSYPIGTSQILIGRDAANCTISYREGTPGVSGRHCSVSWNPDTEEFLITDLRSTYGTFLESGQRLEPNVPYRCRSGEGFFVGDKTNLLRVEVR